MDDVEDDYYGRRGALQYAKDTALYPFRVATSPALLRTYLRTALILLTSAALFVLAAVAYTSFYYTYIPVRGIFVPIYLQYDHTTGTHPLAEASSVARQAMGKWPYALANIQGLISQQKYDVVVEMILPRSETNLQAGNWMLGLELRGPDTVGGGVKGMLGWEEEWDLQDYSQGEQPGTATEKVFGEGMVGKKEKPLVLARSRRPAILTYRSWVTEFAYRALRLPLYVIGWGQESDKVEIGMMEAVEFDRGLRNVPSSLRLEIRSRQPLEVYRVAVHFVAKLEGLRWVMHKYWISSAVVGTGLFWGVEMSLVLLTWGVFTLLFGGQKPEEGKPALKRRKTIQGVETGTATPKTDPAESEPATPLSDTSRTFPTLSSQRPLQYTSLSESVKKEEEEASKLEDIPKREEGEADDEDEDADFIVEEPIPNTAAGVLTDSGIGTSLESGREVGLQRRRSGRKERGEERGEES